MVLIIEIIYGACTRLIFYSSQIIFGKQSRLRREACVNGAGSYLNRGIPKNVRKEIFGEEEKPQCGLDGQALLVCLPASARFDDVRNQAVRKGDKNQPMNVFQTSPEIVPYSVRSS